MSYAKDSRLRESINILLEQSDTRLKRDLMSAEMRLTMDMDAQIL